MTVKPSDYVNLTVAQDGFHDVNFKVKKDAPLQKLMSAYADHYRLTLPLLGFHFKGSRISSGASPESKGIDEGSTILVTCKCFFRGRFAEDFKLIKGDGTEQIIVKAYANQMTAVAFKLARRTPLIKLMSAYAERLKVHPHCLRFCYNGVRIAECCTPNSIPTTNGDPRPMEEEDMEEDGTFPIDVFSCAPPCNDCKHLPWNLPNQIRTEQLTSASPTLREE